MRHERAIKRDSVHVWQCFVGLLLLWANYGMPLEDLDFSIKEINPEYSLEGLMLKPKLQYFGHLMRTADSLEKTLMLGKIEGRRRKGWQRMRWLHGITNAMDMSFGQTPGDGEGQVSLMCCSPWGLKESEMTWRLNNKQQLWLWHQHGGWREDKQDGMKLVQWIRQDFQFPEVPASLFCQGQTLDLCSKKRSDLLP